MSSSQEENREPDSGITELSELLAEVLGLVDDVLGGPLSDEDLAQRRDRIEREAAGRPPVPQSSSADCETATPATMSQAIDWWRLQDMFYIVEAFDPWTTPRRATTVGPASGRLTDQDAADVREEAEQISRTVVSQAEADARRILAEAHSAAQQIVARARREAKAILDAASDGRHPATSDPAALHTS